VSDLLALEHVDVGFATEDGRVSAVSDVSLSVSEGEIFGLVGESGCGKTTLAMALMGLLPTTAHVAGSVRFQGLELLGLPPDELRKLRGDRISMIFQDPMTSLDPTFPVGEQVAETITAHRDVNDARAKERALELLGDVGIPEPERRFGDAPHRLSGGMRQRVVIAIALSLTPELIVMDEPTTALDVVVQREILQQIDALKREFGFAVLFITHDVSLLLEFADRVSIMYAGEIVETTTAERLATSPEHPYTQGLLASFPPLTGPLTRLTGIPGSPPDLRDPPTGCRFHPRCPHCVPERIGLFTRQTTERPVLREIAPGHEVACHLVEEGDA